MLYLNETRYQFRRGGEGRVEPARMRELKTRERVRQRREKAKTGRDRVEVPNLLNAAPAKRMLTG